MTTTISRGKLTWPGRQHLDRVPHTGLINAPAGHGPGLFRWSVHSGSLGPAEQSGLSDGQLRHLSIDLLTWGTSIHGGAWRVWPWLGQCLTWK